MYSWLDETGHVRHSAEEIAWMEEIDRQDREEELKRWSFETAKRAILMPMAGISLDGKQLYRNRYTGDICFENGELLKPS